MNAQSIQASLAGLPIPQTRYFDEIGSTNDEALEWLSKTAGSEQAQDGCLVIANHQSRGRGRFDRRWVTQANESLAFSLILHPTPAEMEHLAYMAPLGALAISQTLEDMGLAPQIKWPNDVLLLGRKAAGILVEAAWLGSNLQGMVIGIGINITPNALPPAQELLFPASSVEEAAQQPVDRTALLRAILSHLFAYRARLAEPEFLQAWQQRLAFQGEWVHIEENGRGSLTGQVIGIDASGSLLLRTVDGEISAVLVGDVHLRPFDPAQDRDTGAG